MLALVPDRSLMDWNPYSDRWRDDPYPMYRELRDRAPVYYSEESDTWTLSRYEDVVAVLKNTQVFSSKVRNAQTETFIGELTLAQRLALFVRLTARMRVTPWKMRRSRMLIQEDGEVHLGMRDL